MRVSQWLALIAAVVGLGCLQVAQRNAVFFSAYAVGDRASRVHSETTDVAWLQARVLELTSPKRLAQVAQDRQLKLVAWSTLSPTAAAGSEGVALVRLEQPAVTIAGRPVPPLVHMAAADPDQVEPNDGTSD